MAGAGHAEGQGASRLLKTLPQRPRSRLVPLPEYADAFIAETGRSAQGSLLDALLKHVRERNRPARAARRLQARAAARRTCS